MGSYSSWGLRARICIPVNSLSGPIALVVYYNVSGQEPWVVGALITLTLLAVWLALVHCTRLGTLHPLIHIAISACWPFTSDFLYPILLAGAI